MSDHPDPDLILNQARHWLFERENKLINYRRKGGNIESTQPINQLETKSSMEGGIPPNTSVTKNTLSNSISSMLRRTSIGSNFLREYILLEIWL